MVNKLAMFAVVIPVGPSDQQVTQLQDSVDALEFYEPGRYILVLVDDAPRPRNLIDVLPLAVRDRTSLIPNPRNGRGNGWAGGGVTAVLSGLAEAYRLRPEIHFILKHDTDALVIAPIADRIEGELKPAVGMLGSRRMRTNPAEIKKNIEPLSRAIAKLGKPLTIWRKTPVGGPLLQICLFGRAAKRYQFIHGAARAGHRTQDHIYGGAYALSAECLRRFNYLGVFSDPLLWLSTPLPDDIVLSLMVRSVGLELVDLSQAGDVFAVRYQGLMDAPEALLRAGYGIIHSVKDRDGRTEIEIRDLFRNHRAGLLRRARRPDEPRREDGFECKSLNKWTE
jgi:hypothetical protein